MLLTGHSIDYEKDEVVERPWNCVDGGDDIENEENEQSCFHCIVFRIRASVHMAGLFAVLYDSIILTQIIPEIKKTMRKHKVSHSSSFYFSYSLHASMMRSLIFFLSFSGSRTTTLLPKDRISLMISASS